MKCAKFKNVWTKVNKNSVELFQRLIIFKEMKVIVIDLVENILFNLVCSEISFQF